ncbi:hypothetical protein FHQ18_06560 [Deferribacter autotrophicus]|uniref:Uncharacterized protein n=1 Tax=Deferribacter autotrophicus TaxID=500465 RepID=A0A5A8F2M3_9BACT|nr:hypothetical protein [Deferribacter autotrophicus]KAA0258053.1 hypothetical protein FHQ18_06560 [Deferribacter autotrophicus]
MTINFDGNIINFRQKIEELGKKKGSGIESRSNVSKSTSKGDKREIVDLVRIKNENWLAANMDIRNEDEAARLVNDLQNLFSKDAKKALLAHDNANADKVLKFYPFE